MVGAIIVWAIVATILGALFWWLGPVWIVLGPLVPDHRLGARRRRRDLLDHRRRAGQRRRQLPLPVRPPPGALAAARVTSLRRQRVYRRGTRGAIVSVHPPGLRQSGRRICLIATTQESPCPTPHRLRPRRRTRTRPRWQPEPGRREALGDADPHRRHPLRLPARADRLPGAEGPGPVHPRAHRDGAELPDHDAHRLRGRQHPDARPRRLPHPARRLGAARSSSASSPRSRRTRASSTRTRSPSSSSAESSRTQLRAR